MKCPACGAEFTVPPAYSRLDCSTPLCPACGTLEEQFIDRVKYTKAELKRLVWWLMSLVPPVRQRTQYRSIDDVQSAD